MNEVEVHCCGIFSLGLLLLLYHIDFNTNKALLLHILNMMNFGLAFWLAAKENYLLTFPREMRVCVGGEVTLTCFICSKALKSCLFFVKLQFDVLLI